MNDHHIASILDRVQKATFVEMLATLAFAMMLVSIVILVEVRTAIFQRYITPDPQLILSPVPSGLLLSEQSVDAITQFAAVNPSLSSVGVVAVNLVDNTRSVLMMIHNNVLLDAAPEEDATWPLFTDDPVNNSDVSSLLNGEFNCTPARYSTLAHTHYTTDAVKTTCRVPVPPYYGRLTGYLIMHSPDELSIYDVDRLRKAALRLSIDIYYASAPINNVPIVVSRE